MKKIILFTLLLIHSFAIAQNEYFEHTVSKGETLYQLSRKYNVKIGQLYNLNPSIEGDLIRIDQILLIPKNPTSTPTQTQDENFIYHIVESGETKYGLQRKYGLRIHQLESDNPHIIDMLQAGHRIRIRKSLIKNNTYLTANQPEPTGNNIHVVTKGETLTAIAKHHNVSLNELVTTNSANLGEFLQIGQQLVIPGQQRSVEPPHDNLVHIVQSGETKYGLSKRYHTTIETLERLNPQTIPMLKAGHTIILPTSPSHPIVQNQETIEILQESEESSDNYPEISTDLTETNYIEQEKIIDKEVEVSVQIDDPATENPENPTSETTNLKYINYEVQPKETLYGLARKAQMTQDQLINLNPSLQDGVFTGMVIKMPSDIEQPPVSFIDAEITVLTPSTIKRQDKKLLFALPFEFSDYEKNRLNTSLDEFMEFYSGALIAIDSIKKLGVDIQLDLINTNTTEISNDYLQVSEPDLIIGVPSKNNVKINEKIPFIYPFDDLNVNSEILIRPIPPTEFRIKTILEFLDRKKANIIAISDLEKVYNKELISQNLPDTKFLQLIDRTTPDSDNFKSLLDKRKRNYIILDTDRTSLFLSTTNMLLQESTDYDIQLVIIEDSPIIERQEVSLIRLRLLKTLYSTLYTQPENKNSSFHKSYFKENKVLPSNHASRGFDITLDVLLRSLQDKTFIESLESQTTQQNRHKFKYKKTGEGQYQNKNMYILYYDTDSDSKPAE